MSGPPVAELAAELAEALRPLGEDPVAVVTGAGISKASGIPTFRGSEPGAVWKQDDVEMATHGFFLRDPVAQWRWYLKRFSMLQDARPNPAHRALVSLERWQQARGGDFLLVTQNIDTLHEEAGSRSLVKVHGTSDRLRCSRPGCLLGAPSGSLPRSEVDLEPFVEHPVRENLPRCPECGALLRAHVLFFDEYYDEHRDYEFQRVRQAAARSSLVLFVGTSFSVGVTDLVLQGALLRGVDAFSVDPGAAGAPSSFAVRTLTAPAEVLLPALCRELEIPSQDGLQG